MAAPRSAPPLADNSPTAVPVDVELVLAVDVSYSMDPEEQALQREGYITGVTSREFMQALRSGQRENRGDLFRVGRRPTIKKSSCPGG